MPGPCLYLQLSTFPFNQKYRYELPPAFLDLFLINSRFSSWQNFIAVYRGVYRDNSCSIADCAIAEKGASHALYTVFPDLSNQQDHAATSPLHVYSGQGIYHEVCNIAANNIPWLQINYNQIQLASCIRIKVISFTQRSSRRLDQTVAGVWQVARYWINICVHIPFQSAWVPLMWKPDSWRFSKFTQNNDENSILVLILPYTPTIIMRVGNTIHFHQCNRHVG